jgi:hypothetical protein
MEFLEDWRHGIIKQFLKNDFKALCMEGIAAEFEGEGSFIKYMSGKTSVETAELLLPYTGRSSNTGSPLYQEYCRIRNIPESYWEERGKLHTRFAKKIRGVFDFIRKESGDEIKEVWDGQ